MTRFLGFVLPLLLASGASALTQPSVSQTSGTAAAEGQTASPPSADAGKAVPATPGRVGTAPAASAAAAPNGPVPGTAAQPGASLNAAAGTAPLPEILRGEAAMPEPVRTTWTKLVEAARSGDVERLRPIMDAQKAPPSVAFQEIQDPIEYLKSLSGDAESREILAILLEVLEAGFVHVDAGTPQEMYVWPYFAQYPLDRLTPPQFVELFRLLTSADYEEMRSYGAYIFFRVGIAPDGTWSFFVAGD